MIYFSFRKWALPPLLAAMLLAAAGCLRYACHGSGTSSELDYYDMTQGPVRILWIFEPDPVIVGDTFRIRIVLQDTAGNNLPATDSGVIYLRAGPSAPVWVANWDSKTKTYSAKGAFPEAGRATLHLEHFAPEGGNISADIPVMVNAKERNYKHEGHGGGSFGGGESCH